jgi:biotin-dependent carboxylase-like uncharacterized protein
MNHALLAVSPGPYVTIQDDGRRGWRRFGVASSGAMDILSLHLANALVANPSDAAALEFAHVGGTWEIAAESCRIAVTGGDFSISADGAALAPWRSHTLRRGQRFMIAGARDAVWGYLAIGCGLEIAPRLGSVATHLRSRLGGLNGRLIAAGDVLPLRSGWAPAEPDRQVVPPHHEPGPIRVVLGPQQDFFAPETIASFLGSPWRVSHRADRMGTWLDGPKIAHAHGFNIVSDGLIPGCVQVPGSGQPVVLLADCQTIGGYPKLATIVTADLPRFAQIRPGRQADFASIDLPEAYRLYVDHHRALASAVQLVREVTALPARPFRRHW